MAITMRTQGDNRVTYTERPEYAEKFARDAATLVRFLEVDWADTDPFVEDMVGYCGGRGGANSLQRRVPEKHPYYESMRCVDVELVEPVGAFSQDSASNPQGHVKWERAVYRCTYRSLPYDVLSDSELKEESDAGQAGCEMHRYVIRRRKWAFENQKVSGAALIYDDGAKSYNGLPIPETWSRPFSILQLEYTWVDVPTAFIPSSAITSCAYHVNDAIWDDYAAETVLFMGADEVQYDDFRGFRRADLKYLFAVRADGLSWNKFTGHDLDWVNVKVQGTVSTRPFATANFKTLFAPK